MASVATLATLNKIREELMCVVCRDTFQTPKTLPCLHTFCAQCIATYSAVQQRDYKQAPSVVECPTCRSQFEYENGVEGIVTNSTYVSLASYVASDDADDKLSVEPSPSCGKCDASVGATAVAFCSDCGVLLCDFCREMHRRLKDLQHHNCRDIEKEELEADARDNLPSPPPVPATKRPASLAMCQKHNGELKWYCIKCGVMVCTDCTVKDHRDHGIEHVGDVVKMKRERVENQAGALKTKLKSIQDAVTRCDVAKQQLEAARIEMARHLASIVDEAGRAIEGQGRDLQAVLDQHYKLRYERIEQCTRQLHLNESQVAGMLEFITAALPEVSDVAALQYKMDCCTSLLEADVSADVDASNTLSLVSNPNGIQEIATLKPVYTCALRGVAFCNIGRSYMQGEEVTVEVQACDLNGNIVHHGGKCTSEVSCHISTLGKDHTFHPTVQGDQNGRHVVRFTPKYPGSNRLCIRMDEGHVEGSPFELKVDRNYVQIAMEPREFTVCNANPSGLAIFPGNKLAVSASDCEVHVFDLPSGTEVYKIKSNFVRPYAMAVDQQGDVWVTDREGHCVQKFKTDGTKLLQFGQKGTGAGQLLNPRGIAIHPTGHTVYVSDMRNNRVQIFDLEGKYKAQFGSPGKLLGSFDLPAGLCFNRSGHLVVCDDRNCRLQVFDAEGQFMNTIGVKAQTGWLCSPIGVCCDANGRYIVSEFGSHCISFLDPEGEILNCVRTVKGYGHFIHPRGVAVDSYGYVYVADNEKMRVIRF